MLDQNIIVIGGGVMGTSAALALARRGCKVTLLEQFDVGHDRGSSHGQSRILRYAYFEHPEYARMVQKVAPMWRAIEVDTGQSLMHRCGGLDIGPRDGELVTGSLRACRELGLEHEFLNGDDIGKRWPFANMTELAGVYQPDACILRADQCVAALEELAIRDGVVVRPNTKVTSIEQQADHVVVETNDSQLHADHVIVTAGAWMRRLLEELDLPLTVVRKAVLYFNVTNLDAFDISRFPIYIVETGDAYYYGFGKMDQNGVKIGDHLGGEVVDPDHVERAMRAEDESHLRKFTRKYLPGADGDVVGFETCLYTKTPDEDFIIDKHPDLDRITIAGGFSGHGFKFGPLIGEILANLAVNGKADHPVERFRINRFHDGT